MTAGQRGLPEAEIVLGEAARIDGVPEGHEIVSVSLGIDGVLTCAWAPPKAQEVLQARDVVPNWASFPVARTSEPVILLITATRDSDTEITAVGGFELGHPRVVRLPRSGDFVAVGARCRLRDGVADKNAWRISRGGELVGEGTLGDGIGHVAATDGDEVWVGYGDEGVFGNYGWGRPGALAPMGAAGLVRFRADFSVAWTYTQPKGAFICDCEAMNVGDDGLFICPYTDFPVVRVANDEITVWEGAGRSASHILVAGSHVAFLTWHGRMRNEGTVVDLATNESRTIRLHGPGVADSCAPSKLAVAGDSLVLVQGRRIFTGRLQP